MEEELVQKLNEYETKLRALQAEYALPELKQLLREARSKAQRSCVHDFVPIGHGEAQCDNCGIIRWWNY
jgi:hypothetical protein